VLKKFHLSPAHKFKPIASVVEHSPGSVVQFYAASPRVLSNSPFPGNSVASLRGPASNKLQFLIYAFNNSSLKSKNTHKAFHLIFKLI